jgi:hypothetical protein
MQGKGKRMTYNWHSVDNALYALRETFGHASVEDVGGFVIQIPIEGRGTIHVGDMDGPLGESGNGWSAELMDPNGEPCGLICKIPDRSVRNLVDALRAFVRNGTRTGLKRRDWAHIRSDEHFKATGHYSGPDYITVTSCAECREIMAEYNAD